MSKSNNPPAFPASPSASDGMNLRDYLAAHAISGSMALLTQLTVATQVSSISSEKIAVMAYEIADAMLKEREN